jgi:hypothetical protein
MTSPRVTITPPPLAPWHDHTGNRCPLPADAVVRVDLGEGLPVQAEAGELDWGPGAGPAGEGRIHRYAVLHPGSSH